MALLRLPQVDTRPVKAAVRDLRDIDLSRLSTLREDLAERDLPADLRRELERIDLRQELDRLDLSGTVRDLRAELQTGIGRLDRELPQVRRVLGRSAPRTVRVGPGLAVGVFLLVGGLVAGGLVAWLLHPTAGAARRKALRRRLHRLQRRIQHAR